MYRDTLRAADLEPVKATRSQSTVLLDNGTTTGTDDGMRTKTATTDTSPDGCAVNDQLLTMSVFAGQRTTVVSDLAAVDPAHSGTITPSRTTLANTGNHDVVV